jgi:hypothetical protein
MFTFYLVKQGNSAERNGFEMKCQPHFISVVVTQNGTMSQAIPLGIKEKCVKRQSLNIV